MEQFAPLGFEWEENWLSLATDAWSHTDVGVLGDGTIVTFDPANADLLFVAASGEIVERTPTPLIAPHGLTPCVVEGKHMLWVADTGVVRWLVAGGFDGERRQPRVALVDLGGQLRHELTPPRLDVYASRPWVPTAVAPVGDVVWVADGYNTSILHAYDGQGKHLASTDGSETGTALDCPHGLLVDPRRQEPRLLVADSGNGRIVEMTPDGTIVATFGQGHLHSPNSFAVSGPYLIVSELFGRLSVFDPANAFVGHLGDGGRTDDREGWPNALGADGWLHRPPVEPDRFNSPHGLTVSHAGQILVTEWMIGGRNVRLSPVRQAPS